MQDILITGAAGMVGSYIDFGIHLTHSELDITDLKAVSAIFAAHKPRAIIHLAAATDLVRCEQDPAYAYRVNSIGTYNVALVARTIGARMVHVSTSGVFDGMQTEPYTEDDTPNPVNVFGHSKYLGELAVRGILADFLIVRTSWIFGGGKEKDKKFVGKILQQRNASEVRAVTDKRGSPTFAKDLASALRILADGDRRGVVHVGGGEATRFAVAREALTLIDSSAKVLEATSADFASNYVSGDNESMPLSPLVRPWRESLKEYIETEWRDTRVT